MLRPIGFESLAVGWLMRVFLVLAMFLTGFTSSSANARSAVHPAAHVYLFRGLANVFSTGMDALGSELAARGYDVGVYSHLEAGGVAAQAAQTQKRDRAPIIIVGHSLGGNAALDMARALQAQGCRVALVVTFGPTYNDRVPANVSRLINYYQAHGVVAATISKDASFRGSLANVNLDSSPSINHLNIDKITSLHAQTISAIGSVARGRVISAPPATHASAAAAAR